MQARNKAMSYTFDIVDIEPVVLAVAQARFMRSEVSSKLLSLFDIAYSWLKTSSVKQAGHNYAIYDQCTADQMRVQAGFPVSDHFPDCESVKCVQLKSGRAVHVKHIGPYGKLQAAYNGLHEWCAREGYKTSGESWEIYGDWNDDPSQLVTDIYFRVAE